MTEDSSRDCDLITSFVDLGPLGSTLPVQLKIPYGFKPGSILCITARCENQMYVSVKDDANNVVQNLEIRVNKNEITVREKSGGKTEPNEQDKIFKARFSFTCVCEAEGYRIFINGKQVEFLKQGYTNDVSILDIAQCQLYKIIYTTIIFDDKEKEDSAEVPLEIPSSSQEAIDILLSVKNEVEELDINIPKNPDNYK